VLLGHRNGDITTHYSAPELEELLATVNKVCEEKSGTGYAETKNGWRVMCQPFDNFENFWRAWHDSKRMAALGSPPAPTAWFVALHIYFNILF